MKTVWDLRRWSEMPRRNCTQITLAFLHEPRPVSERLGSANPDGIREGSTALS